MTLTLPPGVAINAPILPGFETILTEPALALVAKLHRAFEPQDTACAITIDVKLIALGGDHGDELGALDDE